MTALPTQHVLADETTFRLAAIDIDDTLLGPDARISDANARAVDQLRARNVQIVLASGRSHANMLPFHHALGLPRGPIVSAQGAVVRDSEDGTVWSARYLAADTVRTVTTRGRVLGFSIVHYGLDEIFADAASPWQQFDQDRNAQAHRFVPDLLERPIEGVTKIIWLGDPAAIAAHIEGAREEFRTVATVIPTDPPYLEFAAPNTNKATGLMTITERLGIPTAEVMAFGDGNNDVEMLAWAGLGIAMSHGRESAKRAARMVSPAGDHENSLARAITLALS